MDKHVWYVRTKSQGNSWINKDLITPPNRIIFWMEPKSLTHKTFENRTKYQINNKLSFNTDFRNGNVRKFMQVNSWLL